MKRVWLAERVNTSTGLDEELDAQDAFLRKYCKDHDMLVVGTSRVHGSCTYLMSDIISSAHKTPFDVLLAASFSRFVHTLNDFQELKAFTDSHGIEMQTADHPLDMRKHEEALALLSLLQATAADIVEGPSEDDESRKMTMD